MKDWRTNPEYARELERENAKHPVTLTEVPRNTWSEPMLTAIRGPRRVWRSREFLVQEFLEPAAGVLVRLSVNRTQLSGGRWSENITWDELQRIKREVGYGTSDAVEVYPCDADVVNVANMRHLWVLAEPLPFAWR